MKKLLIVLTVLVTMASLSSQAAILSTRHKVEQRNYATRLWHKNVFLGSDSLMQNVTSIEASGSSIFFHLLNGKIRTESCSSVEPLTGFDEGYACGGGTVVTLYNIKSFMKDKIYIEGTILYMRDPKADTVGNALTADDIIKESRKTASKFSFIGNK